MKFATERRVIALSLRRFSASGHSYPIRTRRDEDEDTLRALLACMSRFFYRQPRSITAWRQYALTHARCDAGADWDYLSAAPFLDQMIL